MSDASALERKLRLLADLGLSPDQIISQLLRAGHPPELVRRHFPNAPDSSFVVPNESYVTRRLATGGAATGTEQQGPQPLLRQVQTVARQVLRQPAVPTPALETSLSPPESSDGISFQYVPLIQCSFPHTDPGRETTFTRRNGWLELTLSRPGPSGLPYGVPARLLTIYCASEAVRQQSPEIYLGRSVHEFLRLLDVPVSRGERGSLRTYANQLLRLIHCAISIDENIRDASGRTGLHIRQALFVEEARLWWDEAGGGIGQGSSLVLSPVLYESIIERSAPLSTDAIRQLRKSPMDLDVYAWLVHRLFSLSRPSSISWEQLSGQFGHNYGELRYFRRYFGESLQRVLKVYPEARLKSSEQGLLLLPSRPHRISQRTLTPT